MLSIEQQQRIYDIIAKPVHGLEFYTQDIYDELVNKVEEISTN